ncbi:DUF1016 N-terminal domain-containing protein [Desulfobotulus sp. H1]|uniref:DUF1016 N-terminal domain-containing protein n=1 Tax=Desulfobotulus pelophilus TaxID=2823377 RepID=A0ABT3NAP6_9BACT|nr:DUF1016 N-terminal domain-containing protein [Desulfobotulus pelophilus]MCW7754246.1 DUF1016 N-terminal domain-containing protein [Desulfobotulus pelophilus]
MISGKDAVWGSKFLEHLASDLKKEFPDMQGFSVTNLKYCRVFFEYIEIRPQIGDENKGRIIPQITNQLAPSSKSGLSWIKAGDL